MASNTTALKEIAEGYSVLVNPESVEDIAKGIKSLISDENVVENTKIKGLSNAKNYTWDKTTQLINDSLKTLKLRR